MKLKELAVCVAVCVTSACSTATPLGVSVSSSEPAGSCATVHGRFLNKGMAVESNDKSIRPSSVAYLSEFLFPSIDREMAESVVFEFDGKTLALSLSGPGLESFRKQIAQIDGKRVMCSAKYLVVRSSVVRQAEGNQYTEDAELFISQEKGSALTVMRSLVTKDVVLLAVPTRHSSTTTYRFSEAAQ